MNIYDFLALFVVASILLIIFLVYLKMYYYYKVEESRNHKIISSFVKFIFISSKLVLGSTIKYLFTFPKQGENDNSNIELLIKKHFWTVWVLIFIIFIDIIFLSL